MRQNLLYLTGVGGESITSRQERYVSWRGSKLGWNVIFFDSKWTSDELLEQKLRRLDDVVTPLDKSKTAVLAVSAGATELVYLFQKYPDLSRGLTFAGAAQGSKTIGEKYRQRAPQLQAAQMTSESIISDNPTQFADRVTVYRPFHDEVVAQPNMLIGDATLKRIPMVGHVASIVTALTFQFPRPNES